MALMEISTVIGCINRCEYCPQDLVVRKYAERSSEVVMTLQTFKTCLDKLSPDIDVVFAGMSEPWLNPNCTEMLLLANSQGHAISVFSTLVGLRVQDVLDISRVLFKKFIVHLPSIDHQEHISVGWEYRDVLRALTESPIHTVFVHHGKDVHPDVKPLLRSGSSSVVNITRAGNILPRDCRRPLRKNGRLFCAQNLHRNNLLPNGDVVLCCMDFGLQHLLGNLLVSSYEDLFKSETMNHVKRGMRDASLGTLCRFCERAFHGNGLFEKAHLFAKDICFDLKSMRSPFALRRFLMRSINLSYYFSDRAGFR